MTERMDDDALDDLRRKAPSVLRGIVAWLRDYWPTLNNEGLNRIADILDAVANCHEMSGQDVEHLRERAEKAEQERDEAQRLACEYAIRSGHLYEALRERCLSRDGPVTRDYCHLCSRPLSAPQPGETLGHAPDCLLSPTAAPAPLAAGSDGRRPISEDEREAIEIAGMHKLAVFVYGLSEATEAEFEKLVTEGNEFARGCIYGAKRIAREVGSNLPHLPPAQQDQKEDESDAR